MFNLKVPIPTSSISSIMRPNDPKVIQHIYFGKYDGQVAQMDCETSNVSVLAKLQKQVTNIVKDNNSSYLYVSDEDSDIYRVDVNDS